MLDNKRSLSISAAALAVAIGGCASTHAPADWLPRPGESQSQGYGAWVELQREDGGTSEALQGELVAVHTDTIFVLWRDTLTAVPLRDIRRARLEAYESQADILMLWTVLGALSTPSHGYAAAITLPAWFVVGTISSAAQSYAPIHDIPKEDWQDLAKYARFPAGLPEGLNRNSLRSKPLPR